ncbi:hypothetical protein [Acidaminococcus fermentans]|uniref:hypothetical protein n=1 Tax=Acidaminococcus fermentans TaxID=905 RepID=UPI00242D5B0B|nr:hypothetical protein [Acidaminococcus fermentans]MEE0338136.1 hypothetical protein [Acidaminococcus fermentans]
MKKSLFFPLLIVSLLSVPSLLFAQEAGSGTEKPAVSVANNTKTAAPSGTVSQEVLPTPPSEESAAWTLVGGNSSYEVYYDTRSLQYDEKTGIITIWNKWVRKGAMGTAKTILLQSRYDVRLRVVSDLVQYTYNGLGQETGQEKVADQSWYPLSPNTLGMELCQALKGYLLNQ